MLFALQTRGWLFALQMRYLVWVWGVVGALFGKVSFGLLAPSWSLFLVLFG